VLPEPNTTIPNRRVYFLAVNHRRADLQDARLRRALVRAIDREKLLDDHFRGPLKQQVHKALNGPYPAGSWANNPEVPHGVHKNSLDPFDPEGAGSKLDELTRDAQRYRPPTLSLKYPSGDSAVKAAMTSLAGQIEKNLPGVKVAPEEVNPWALRDAVEKTHDFDLAYYHYDFPDDTNSLWPLFGGDENYFGFPTQKEGMSGLLRDSVRFCDFQKVKEQARQLHLAFDQHVPLIPLWQLDPLLAIHDDVKTVPFDRNLIFTDIEQWRLEGKKPN